MDIMGCHILDKVINFFRSIDDFPEKYKIHYIGSYWTGFISYYIPLCNRAEVAEKVKEAFEVYSDLLDE